jgi:hypothetical protein
MEGAGRGSVAAQRRLSVNANSCPVSACDTDRHGSVIAAKGVTLGPAHLLDSRLIPVIRSRTT